MTSMTCLSSPDRCGDRRQAGKKAAPILDPSAPPFLPPSRRPTTLRTFPHVAFRPSPPLLPPPSPLVHAGHLPRPRTYLLQHPRYIPGNYYPRPTVLHPPRNHQLSELPLLNPRPLALSTRDEGKTRLLQSVGEEVALNNPRSSVPLLQENKRCVRKNGRKSRPDLCLIPSEGSGTPSQIEAICSLPSGVTTLMIRNLPNLFRREDLLEILDKHCGEVNGKVNEIEITVSQKQRVMSEYDFVYLPFDFRQNMNLGYAFVNFTTPIAAARMSRAYHGFRWKGYSSDMRSLPLSSSKVCEICPAAIQGRAALDHHLGKREYPQEEFQPVAALERPCDGTGRPPLLLVGTHCDVGGRSHCGSLRLRKHSGQGRKRIPGSGGVEAA